MPFLIQYLIKLFICFAIVYLFYRLVLCKLTFYNWNRWYLLGYSLLCFLIPFINITPVLQSNQLSGNSMVQIIPAMDVYTGNIGTMSDCPVPVWSTNWSKWDWALLIVSAGALVLLVRLFIRYYSLYRLRRGAKLIGNDGMKLYQVDKPIMPFSFGDSIFINRHLHDEQELQEIIRHEFVHVRQKHSHDIIMSEIFCIVNWYNPFAWMIRKAIRQNLEFIADNKVLENGFDRKQYQYLLLKVVGNNHFRIANQFNFSSLKKRIAMMNQMKSARTHLFKFLFILPLVAVMLLAFRNEVNRPKPAPIQMQEPQQLTDTPRLNDKGYNVEIIGVKENCTVVVKDANGKEVERLLLTKWDEKESYYEGLYGNILPPPPPPPPASPRAPIAKLPKGVSSVRVQNNNATVTLKDGTTEYYNLDDEKGKADYKKKYGELPPPPPPPPAPPVREVSVTGVNASEVVIATNVNSPVKTAIALNTTPAVAATGNNVNVFSGTSSNVHVAGGANTFNSVALTPNVSSTVNVVSSVNSNLAATVNPNISSTVNAVKIAPSIAVGTNLDPLTEVVVTGKPSDREIILEFRITKNTSREMLDQFVAEAKAKDVSLSFDKLKYNSNNELRGISGKMRKGGTKSEFTINSDDEVISIILRIMKDKNSDKYSMSIVNNSHREEI